MTYAKSFLVFVLLAALTNEGQMANWLSNLNQNLESLQHQIQQSVQNLQQDINTRVQDSVAHVNDVSSKINADIKEAIKNGAFSTTVSGVNGGTTVMSSPGVSRSITSGSLPNGQPFWYDVEDKVIGQNLYHTERYYSDPKKGIQVFSYMLNLYDLDSKPVPIYESS